jgi:hypothetical protein
MTYLVFTIDVCWTAGKDFEGAFGGRNYGIPFIVDTLEHYGISGSFFVSPYAPARLEDTVYNNLRYLVTRGQDLQLHTHLDAWDFNRPVITDYSAEEKKKILEHGIGAIVRAGAASPIAHRSGKLAIDEDTLRILPEFGIHFDSSIYHRVEASRVRLPESQANRIVKLGDVYELPIMLIRTLPFTGRRGTTAFQLDSTVIHQQLSALRRFADHQIPLVVILLHFFSFYKRKQPDRPFEPLVINGAQHRRIADFYTLLEMVTTDKCFDIVTVSELWNIFREDPGAFQTQKAFIPCPGLLPAYIKCYRHWSERPLNKIMVVGPWLILLTLISSLLFFFWESIIG